LLRDVDRAVADRPADDIFRRMGGTHRPSSWHYLGFLTNRREEGTNLSVIEAGRLLAVPHNQVSKRPVDSILNKKGKVASRSQRRKLISTVVQANTGRERPGRESCDRHASWAMPEEMTALVFFERTVR
jgi:hypothetical protein